jgi:hypothetical protein
LAALEAMGAGFSFCCLKRMVQEEDPLPAVAVAVADRRLTTNLVPYRSSALSKWWSQSTRTALCAK